MKRLISLFLVMLMILGTATEVFATELTENTPRKQVDPLGIESTYIPNDAFGFEHIMPASIAPLGKERHEFRFYASKEDADAAQSGTANQDNPIDIKFVRTGGNLAKQDLLEQKDELFEGWFYTENGEEKEVPFGNQQWIAQDKTFYAYPKRHKVIAVFFSHESTIHKSIVPDADGTVSINSQPGVGEAGKVLKGWSMEKKFNTVEEAKAEGKLFYFKEDKDPTASPKIEPTVVNGTLVLHAIFEDAVRVSFDSHGSTVIPGVSIESGQSVKVPDSARITKEGYKFQYWYVLEEDEQSINGLKEVKLNTVDKQGIKYFDYKFKKDTTIHAKWQGTEVPFNIVFMIEKRPDQIKAGEEKYSFLGSFKNLTDQSLQLTKGIAGSQITFDYDDHSAPPAKITSLDKDQFKSYLEEENRASNLLKYGKFMRITNLELLKGFHVNKQKTNEENPVIEGNGLTTKLIYLDRDTVHLRVITGDEYKYNNIGDLIGYTPGSLVDDETKHPDALGNFKYGQILLENDANRGWNYLFNTYIKKNNAWRWLGNYDIEGRSFFSIPPFAVESVLKDGKTASYMKRNAAKNAWIFEFHDGETMGETFTLLTIPLRLPINQQELTYEEAKNWIKDEDVESLKNRLLPNKETPLIGKMGEMPDWMYVESVDYALIDGYETINTTIKNPGGWPPNGCTPSLKENTTIKKLKQVADITDSGKYLVMPIIYKKQKFSLQFDSRATGNLSSTTIEGIPYNSTIVGPTEPDGDPNLPEKEKEVKDYLSKFVPAEIDPNTKEVTNLEKVTKNQDEDLFMGWYLDPGYTIPFDIHMPMPAQNLRVFAKWEPLYHSVIVHHLPAGINGVNKPENITEIRVPHGQLINTQEEILKNPPILSGRAKSDFQGWETYGDIKTEEPSSNGEDGGPFLYKFDKPVNKAFHLYPRWYVNRVGVVYALNYEDDKTQPLKSDEIETIMGGLDDKDAPLVSKDRYHISEYKYPLGAKVRLRAPLGWNDSGKIIEPVAPQGTKAYGKIFLGWKVMYRDKLEPFTWHTVDNLVYYNSQIAFTENNISHKSGIKRGDAVGVMVLVAQWGEKKNNTSITLHRNHNIMDLTTKEYDIENPNQEWRLPNLEDSNDLTNFVLDDFTREKYQFLGWNEKQDGSGKMYKPGESIYIDETHDVQLNHLYAQWEKYYTLEAKKVWDPDKTDYTFKMGLLKWTKPSGTANPDFTSASNFKPVPNSLKNYKQDLENGTMKWEVPGLDKQGKRYSYVIVEVTPEMEDRFHNFTSWESLNVAIDKTLKTKTQTITLKDANNKVDAFTSATVRQNKVDQQGKIIGYTFTVTNKKIIIPTPVITQPYADQKVILLTPGKDLNNQVEKIEVTLPNNIVLELTKDKNGHFTNSNNNAYNVTADATGKLTIKLPDGQVLEKNQVIKAVAKNAGDVSSELDSKTVLDAQDSFKIEKPAQEKRDSDYNVVITTKLPKGITVKEDTTFTLTDANGNPIVGKDGQPITAIPNQNGDLTFKIPDGILKDGQQVKVKTKEPSKNSTLSELSEPLDIDAPEITADDIKGIVNVPLGFNKYKVTVTDKDLTDLKFRDENLPAGLSLAKAPNKPNTSSWKVLGAGKYIISDGENHQVTYTATDRFGNKATKTIQVIISGKDVVDTPVIDDISKGDTSVKITPPTKGDSLVVTFPGNKKVTLTKNNDGKWTDGNSTYEPDNAGKIDISVPDNGTLDVGNLVTAYGEDSTGTLKKSEEATKSVRPSRKKTPAPQFKKITVGDENFKIKPVDQVKEGIITDKLVITIRNQGQEEKKITLTKTNDKWSDGTKEYTPDGEGYITIALEGITLTQEFSFGATGKDTLHGHETSDPTSINVNAEQSQKPTAEQGKSKENGNATITGTGVPGADIRVYDPVTGNLIAGPVKVDPDGNYEIEVPENLLPANGDVVVKQKEDCKPESDAEPLHLNKTAKPLIPAKTKVTVRKVWEGIAADDAPEIIVYLLKNSIKTDKFIKLNKQNKWVGIFTNLDTVDSITDNKKNEYTVKEEAVGGYRSKITGDAEHGFVITNTKENGAPNPPVIPDNPNPPVIPDNPNPPVTPDKPNPPVKPDKPNPPVIPDNPNPPVIPDNPNPPVVKPNKPNPPVVKPDKPNPSIHDKTTHRKDIPQTGNGVNLEFYAGLMVISGGLLILMKLKRRRKVK